MSHVPSPPEDPLVEEPLRQALWRERACRQRLELELLATQTALAQAQAELVAARTGARNQRHEAMHDSLTTLPNRRGFLEHLDQMLTRPELVDSAMAVLYLDLDGFKAINDQHGHAIGDELLRIVALRLDRAVRTSDMMSRLGGDEFACLLLESQMNRPLLEAMADKMYDTVSAPIHLGALRLQVRPSIGIALYPEHGLSAAALIRHADAAMYQAKRAQSHFRFFSVAEG
jgi:diguanylate cyclase (GGDEF)-like protein